MSEPSLLWVDWRLAPRSLLGDSLWRIAFLALAAFALLALLLSGGANRFLASRYAITAVLRTAVPPGGGEGLARKVEGLPPVRSAAYRDPEAAWKEFLLAYPGLESLRAAGGHPLPGYIEIRLRPERLTAADIGMVVSALRPVPYVEKVLAGEDRMPRLLRAKYWAAVIAWGVFASFAAAFCLVFVLQDRCRAYALSADFAFLAERGVPTGRMAALRAAGAALWVLFLASVGVVLAGAALRYLLQRYPVLGQLLGSPDDLLLPATLGGVAGFLLGSALLGAVSSLLGFRAARAGRR